MYQREFDGIRYSEARKGANIMRKEAWEVISLEKAFYERHFAPTPSGIYASDYISPRDWYQYEVEGYRRDRQARMR